MTDITEQQIEEYIDKHGLIHLFTLVECICGEKAEHIRVNWQDRPLARDWDKASRIAGKAARDVNYLG